MADRSAPSPARDVVWPERRRAIYEKNFYSPAIRSGGFLFVSGQVGSREDGSPEPDPAEQVRLAFRNLNEVLAAAGCVFGDVVDLTFYIVDAETNFDTVIGVLPEFWGEPPYSTITAVGVTWLSGFLFEIKVVAKLRDGAA